MRPNHKHHYPLFLVVVSSKVKLSRTDIEIISNRITLLSDCIPKEINRKPRNLQELARYKATEFRTFLLYLGPAVLPNVVDLAVYEHFLLLHAAISILCSAKHFSRFPTAAVNAFLKTFIEHGEKLYGNEFIIYNVHLLSHLCDDVLVYGPLDNFSAFPFENYLGQLKRLLKSNNNPLAQVYRRVSEIENARYDIGSTTDNQNSVSHYLSHNTGPLLLNHISNVTQFKKVQMKNFILTIHQYSQSDSYCLINNKLIQIKNFVLEINGNTSIIGKEFKSYTSLYHYPLESSDLSISIVSNLNNFNDIYNLKDVECKCIVLELEGKCMCFPLLYIPPTNNFTSFY